MTIDGKEYELGEYTLRTELWVNRKYGSAENFIKLVAGVRENGVEIKPPDLEAQLELVLQLLKNKTDFKSIEELAEKIDLADYRDIYVTIVTILNDSTIKVKKTKSNQKAMQK